MAESLAIPYTPWSARATMMGVGITAVKGAGLLGARAIKRIGISLQNDTGLLRKVAEGGPANVKGMAQAAYEAAQAGDPKYRIIVQGLVATPAFRKWVESGESQSVIPEIMDDRDEEQGDLARRISSSPQALADEVMAADAPESVMQMAEQALLSSERGLDAYRAAVSVMLSSPEFQEWASASLGAERAASTF